MGLAALLVGTASAWAAPQQQEEGRASDWAMDNLDWVSASPEQIRDVLSKEPGLMVELKRLMAKQATDHGQIVVERDLADSVILERLTKDARFRALATRLLQRYGYLTPQLNPKSPAGEEQDLLLKAKAERLARASTEAGPEAARPEIAGHYDEGRDQARYPAEELTPGSMTAPTPAAKPRTNAPLAEPPANEELQPGLERTEPPAPSLLTASGASPTQPLESSTKAGVPPSEYIAEVMNPALVSDSLALGSSQNKRRARGFEEMADLTGGMPSTLPEPVDRRPPRTGLSRNGAQGQQIPEPVTMVKSPNPYVGVPSLYDLYVQAAPRTGQLERFGLEMFRRSPESTGIPIDLPAGPEYVLGPGDGLTIDLWGGVSQRLFRTVDREGRLSLPEAGPLLASGKTLGEVQEVVQRILRTQYRDVSADVSLSRLRTVRVYVVGEVVSPGAYDLSSLSTPLNALWAASGVTSRGSLRLLRHSQGRQIIEEVDVYDLLLHGVRGDLRNLENGDTLLVPPVGPQVTVDGMVRRPAIYELREEANLASVLDLAGGVLPAAALRHIEVQRLEAHEKRTMLSVNLDDAKDAEAVRRQLSAFAVHDGDEVHVFPIAPYNSAAVYLQGHVLRPGRYAYTQDMRVTDLVGSYHDLLPEPASHYAEIIRLHAPDWRPVVESFDLAAALANPLTSPNLEPLDTVRILSRFDVEPAPMIWVSGEVRNPGEVRTSGQMHFRDAVYQAGGLMPDAALDSAQLFRREADGTIRILNVNLAAALKADPLENVLVEPRDRIVVHRSQFRVDPASVYVEGEVANPGRYPLGANMRVGDLLRAAGGPMRSADLKNADLTRYRATSGAAPTGTHERVDLTTVFQEASRNFPLEDGDVLSVPELPGWKDVGASVTVIGEVKNPGVYGIRPGERLSSLLTRAGGELPAAYPQGIIFTRPSVRELQEKARQELIQRLEQEAPQVKSAVSSSGNEEVALQMEAMQQRDRAIEALKRAPLTGRLVIRLQPGLKGFEHSTQDVELRNGDAIEIPKRPGFVLVVGQVYNTNAITYTPGKNASWYLSQGGGPTRLADKGAIFIVRANGEVVSRHQGGWWSGNVLSTAIRPGDSIVVPERPVLSSARWKNIIALAQVAEAGDITAAVLP